MKISKLALFVTAVAICTTSSAAMAVANQATMTVNGEVNPTECTISVPETVALSKANFVDIQNSTNNSIVGGVDEAVTIQGCQTGQALSVGFNGQAADGSSGTFKNTVGNNAATNVGVKLLDGASQTITPGQIVAAPLTDINGSTSVPFTVGYSKVTPGASITAGFVASQVTFSIIQQ